MPNTFDSEEDTRSTGNAVPHQNLSRMINQGRSFSGHERNCCFLNLGNQKESAKQFANISVGSGVDFPDDGRSVVAMDWDGDGDQDLWITNRNAPRVRFMRNNSTSESHYLSLLLLGDGRTTNRDAVGARVEVHINSKPELAGGESNSLSTKRIATLRAGEGFLAQSSKSLHFGLGTNDRIEKVIVRWPNRDVSVEEFSGLAVDTQYRLIQGSGQPRIVTRRGRPIVLTPSVPKAKPSSRAARVPAVSLLQGPTLKVKDPKTGKVVSPGEGKPLLINLWATWCPACITELSELRDHESEIRAAGLEVLAISVDGLMDDVSNRASAEAALDRMKFPFFRAMASQPLLDSLQKSHDSLVALHRPLPIPTSFLLDERGRVSVIYKGRLKVDQLLVDLKHSHGTRIERWLRSTPLPGSTIPHATIARTADALEATTHLRFAIQQQEKGLPEDAEYHYLEALRIRPDFLLAHRHLGMLYLKTKRWKKAETHLQQVIIADSNDSDVHFALARSFFGQKQLTRAESALERTIRVNQNHVPALYDLGSLLHTVRGQASKAIHYYQRVLEIDPNHIAVQNNLAWLYATHPDSQIRNATEALRLAHRVVAQPAGKNAIYLDLLGVAYAECGEFENAIVTARKALAAARVESNTRLSKQIEQRIALYSRNQAYREPLAER